MIHPIPSGTRDVLPDEMRELRAISSAMLDVFTAEGYGEIVTPSLEYEAVLARGGAGGPLPAYRVVDDHGAVLALRSDMTVPIARVVATRYPNAEPPLRFCYFANAFRSVRPHRGQQREFLQAGVELIGSPAPEGTAEALRDPVRRARRDRPRALPRRPRRRLALPGAARGGGRARGGARRAPARALDARLRRAGAHGCASSTCAPRTASAAARPAGARRGEVLAEHAGAVAGLQQRPRPAAGRDARERVIFDLGLVRDLAYYTGAVFEVYDPAMGQPIGGGGRYDDLLGRFGRPLPAVGLRASRSTRCTSR